MREGEGEGEHLALAARSLKGALKANLVGVLYRALYATAKTHADGVPREAPAEGLSEGARVRKCATRPTPHVQADTVCTHVAHVEDVILPHAAISAFCVGCMAFCGVYHTVLHPGARRSKGWH